MRGSTTNHGPPNYPHRKYPLQGGLPTSYKSGYSYNSTFRGYTELFKAIDRGLITPFWTIGSGPTLYWKKRFAIVPQ